MLRRDTRGAALVEFAIVAPVMCLLLMGGFDVGHTLYMKATLQGVVQKTARDSSLESGTSAATRTLLDDKVRKQVKALADNADVVISRRFYRTFAEAAAARAETWTDTNGNRTCDAGEPYQDDNANSTWDADGGNAGQGGAKDRTVYTVTVTYPHMFPLYKFIGAGSDVKVVASTVLENQPYADQASYTAPVVRNCT